jgi:hypothetical protein
MDRSGRHLGHFTTLRLTILARFEDIPRPSPGSVPRGSGDRWSAHVSEKEA